MAKGSKRTAVVTGANRGIGYEIARELARRGYRVVVTARDARKGRAAAKALVAEGGDVAFHALDVTSQASVRRLARDVPVIDVLVNNAGVYLEGGYDAAGTPSAGALATTRKVLHATLLTNLYGPFWLCQAVLPGMVKRGNGRIVNVSSGSGQLSRMGRGEAAYRMSKTALNAMTALLATEFKGTGVLINAFCPGWVRTDMGGPHATRTVAQGADTGVWLATLPKNGPHGGFFRDRAPIPW
ncbi:MAG: SDR family oxidoreductase [Alphaproteobacteria bacterium]|nr:SDR family oxidoreductase [Alphaproteobacteria bacterium]